MSAADPEEANLSAFQIKDRRQRTVFIGNLSLDCSPKQLKKLFTECGPIEKLWFRSIATTQDSKMPERAKIITGSFGVQKDNKNAYILFKEKDSVQKALAFNQRSFMEKHIRVDINDSDQKQKDDFTTTVFVGSLPFIASEEEVRAHFSEFGTILNVRLVRDPKTHLGKGIGFVQFSSQDEMKLALASTGKFKGRELRLKRATDPKKREKKANRKQAAREARRAAKIGDSDDEEAEHLQSKLKAYDSDDSEASDKPKVKIPKVTDLSDKIGKIGTIDKGEDLKVQNMVAYNQRKRQSMLREMIAMQQKGKKPEMTQTSAHKATHNELFKREPTKLKKILKVRREKHRSANLKKLN